MDRHCIAGISAVRYMDMTFRPNSSRADTLILRSKGNGLNDGMVIIHAKCRLVLSEHLKWPHVANGDTCALSGYDALNNTTAPQKAN